VDIPEIDVVILVSARVVFECECGEHNSYTIFGNKKPERVVCKCGKEFRSR
jgi:hypothetical protein